LPIRNHSTWRNIWDRAYGALTPWDWPALLAWTLYPKGDIKVEEQTVRVPIRLAEGACLRIAFASDFHAGPATPWPLIEAAVARLAGLEPDLLLLGGDFVDIDSAQAGRLASLLATVDARYGRFAVLGNHDHWAGAPTVVKYLQQAGIEMLTNRAINLPFPFDGISVCGLDDYTAGEPDVTEAFAEARGVRVVLMHAPSGLLDIGHEAFDVAICGHTHGGQITLPSGRPLVVGHGPLSRQYNAGRYSLSGNRTLLVSRGVGCGTLPIRWNAPSAVLLCTIIGSDSIAAVEAKRTR
jgi:predicted MPP superfamily phosphohydrolase